MAEEIDPSKAEGLKNLMTGDDKLLEKKAKEQGFTDEEITALKNIKNQDKAMASKIIKLFLTNFVDLKAKQKNFDKISKQEAKVNKEYQSYQKILSKLKKIHAFDTTGHLDITVPFKGQYYQMRMQLSLTPLDYSADIFADSNCHKEIQHYMDKIIDMGRRYYNIFVSQFEILTDLAEFAPEVDFSILKVSTFNGAFTGMYLDPAFDRRIGILVYYPDSNGNPIDMKRKLGISN